LGEVGFRRTLPHFVSARVRARRRDFHDKAFGCRQVTGWLAMLAGCMPTFSGLAEHQAIHYIKELPLP
jgi:hypothetical protein